MRLPAACIKQRGVIFMSRFLSSSAAGVVTCAAGVVTRTTDRDSTRFRYSGIRRVQQLAFGCESN